MNHIVIISSSVRIDRKSHWVAKYILDQILKDKKETVEILDLKEYDFPIFDERLKFQKNPSKKVIEFANKIDNAQGVIIVSPEYNGGYPASLKNAIDLLGEEWKHKPVAISTVSSGSFGGSECLISLQFSLWKLHAITVPARFPVPKVEKNYNEKGEALFPEDSEKRFKGFINELRWGMEAALR